MNNSIEKYDENKIICVICLDEIDQQQSIENKEVLICRCIEKIHEICLKEWLKINNSCPLCRKQLKVKEEESFNDLYLNELNHQTQHPYYNEELELIEIYEDRRIRLQKVKYLLRLAIIILIITAIFSGINIIQKLINSL